MFISVDLPAPFSPSSACTSPSRRSKSTSSFATIPGKRFVMWRISSTVLVASAIEGGFYGSGRPVWNQHGTTKRAGHRPALLGHAWWCVLAVRDACARRLEGAVGNLLRPRVELGDQRRPSGHRRADLAVADAAILRVEETVDAALVLAVLHELDRLRNACIDLLLRARQHLRAEERLVVVDTDAPGVRVLGSGDGAEAATTGDLEDDVRALTDLVESDRLALVLRNEVLRVAVERLDARLHLLAAVLVARDVRVDRRDLEAADGRDRARLRRGCRIDTCEAAGLLLGEDDAADVLRLALEARRVDVDDRELRLRVLLCNLGNRVAHEEADGDDEVVTGLGSRRKVRDVVRRALRDEDPALDAVLALGDLEAVVRKRVEALVVEATDVRDHGHLQRRCRLMLGGRGGAGPDDGKREHRDEREA